MRTAATDPSRSTRDLPATRRSLALERGMAMLECFSQAPNLGVRDMSQMMSTSSATAQRYARTLVALGFLEQNKDQRYRLAPGAADVSLVMLSMIATHLDSQPDLEELRDQTGHTASLAVMDGPRAIYVQRVYGHGRGQYEADLDLRTGAHLPLHSTAVGKAMLASQTAPQQSALIDDMQLTRMAPNTITSEFALIEQLAQIGTKGLAISDEEQAPGVRSIAQAVYDPIGGHTFAVEVTAPAADYTPKQLERHIGPKVRTAARFIAGQLRR
ncbi:MAG: IclR family transcriptional regulator [Solirubrobacteraceae bacterium]